MVEAESDTQFWRNCDIRRASYRLALFVQQSNKTFKPILRKTKNIIDVENATADKGYDSEENHRFAHKEIGANSVIPLRYEVPLNRTTGFYRRKPKRSFPYDIYHQRSKVETVNSVQKRKFGDELNSRLLKMQRREMKVTDVVYNIHRYINHFVSVCLGFLQSQHFKNLTVTV